MEGRVEGKLGSEVVGLREGNIQEALREMKIVTDQYLTQRLLGSEEPAKPKQEADDSDQEES